MGRDGSRLERALPYGYGRDEGATARPVWVALPVAYPAVQPSADDDSSGDGSGDGSRVRDAASARRGRLGVGDRGVLVLDGEVRGELYGWERGDDGQWLGVVSYAVPLRGDVRPAKQISLGLVPAAALRPRDPHDDAR